MDETNENETLCGLGAWRPKFLQFLASKKVYMFFYGAIGIIKVNKLYIQRISRENIYITFVGYAIHLPFSNAVYNWEEIWHQIKGTSKLTNMEMKV